jgi:hypothetical protein
MGRQSGNLLLGTALLVCVFSAGLSSRMTASTPVAGDSYRQEHDNECGGFSAGAWLPGNDKAFAYHSCPVPAVPHQPARAVLRNLRRGTRIVVGSLDVTGARHVVTLANSASVGESGEPIFSMRLTSGEANRHRRTAAAADMPPASAVDLCDASLPRDANVKVHPAVSVDSRQISTHQLRSFLLPHFRNTGVIQEPATCELLYESSRVRIYLDPRHKNSKDARQLQCKCEWLISAAESEALPIAETWIGKISDVDHDEKLTLAITNLDECTSQSNDVAPVHGCIRNVDFHCDSVLGGDIVYLDVAILNLPRREQASLLTHELAHAAVCSIPLERRRGMLHDPLPTPSSPLFSRGGRNLNANMPEVFATRMTTSDDISQIPSWLNEAVAHLMELQCTLTADPSAASSGNFQRRIEDFLSNTACSPIVAAENVMSLNERRSGSRGAATLFLKPWLTSPELLQKFLNSEASLDHRMEVLADKSFAEIFRDWTLSMAAMPVQHPPLHADDVSTGNNREQFSLLGTAFRCFECPEDVSMLVIESDVAAKLQISIIEPDTRTVMQPVTPEKYANNAEP